MFKEHTPFLLFLLKTPKVIKNNNNNGLSNKINL